MQKVLIAVLPALPLGIFTAVLMLGVSDKMTMVFDIAGYLHQGYKVTTLLISVLAVGIYGCCCYSACSAQKRAPGAVLSPLTDKQRVAFNCGRDVAAKLRLLRAKDAEAAVVRLLLKPLLGQDAAVEAALQRRLTVRKRQALHRGASSYGLEGWCEAVAGAGPRGGWSATVPPLGPITVTSDEWQE